MSGEEFTYFLMREIFSKYFPLTGRLIGTTGHSTNWPAIGRRDGVFLELKAPMNGNHFARTSSMGELLDSFPEESQEYVRQIRVMRFTKAERPNPAMDR